MTDGNEVTEMQIDTQPQVHPKAAAPEAAPELTSPATQRREVTLPLVKLPVIRRGLKLSHGKKGCKDAVVEKDESVSVEDDTKMVHGMVEDSEEEEEDWVELDKEVATMEDGMQVDQAVAVPMSVEAAVADNAPATATLVAASNPFVDMLMPLTAKAKTENDANAFSTSLDGPLDFFATVVADTSVQTVWDLLDKAWVQSPETTLRCIFQLRDIRGGKSEDEKFVDCLVWLMMKHPKTLLANLKNVPRVGYWKDLLNFLVRITVGEEEHATEATNVKAVATARTGKKAAQKALDQQWKTVLAAAQEVDSKLQNKPEGYPHKRVVDLFHKSPSTRRQMKLSPTVNPLTHRPFSSRAEKHKRWFQRLARERAGTVPPRDREVSRAMAAAHDAAEKEKAATLRRLKRQEHARLLRERFEQDNTYREIHLEVARLFAQALETDRSKMLEQERRNKMREAKDPEFVEDKDLERQLRPGLAAKWMATLDGHHDKITFITSTVAQILYPPSAVPQREDQTYESYVIHLRNLMVKEYVNPLRRHTQVVESLMGAGEIANINYERVPAVSLRRNRPKFEELDGERFSSYLESVKSGTKTIAASALKPHELVEEILKGGPHYDPWAGLSGHASQVPCPACGQTVSTYLLNDHLDSCTGAEEGAEDTAEGQKEKGDEEEKLRELQWASYRDRLTRHGKLNHVLPLSDVSGSMAGTPMSVSIALGILCAEVTAPPFDNLVCTFSTTPEFFRLPPKGSLREKVLALSQAPWGGSTDFKAVFDLILKRAKDTNLPPEEMISMVLVFSDMEFNDANSSAAGWESLYQTIKREYAEAGYAVPRMVFWNLRGNNRTHGNPHSFPVTKDESGVAMLAGFSGQMLKMFMDGELEINPIKVMNKAIQKYKFVRVVD
ncbi:hypothetical protein HK104_006612 [Borealophlyctis nickersoniae]|nr:hypothetical protein HK104_006612 [Borealophlyctis nickersoniae]